MMKSESKFDLEDRLIRFSLMILTIAEGLPATVAGKHFAQQLVRSGTAPAFNYAEAQAAESRNDFIHKMKLSLKELRETMVNLKIICLKPLTNDKATVEKALQENNELVSIFVKSISTAQNNNR